MKRILSMFLAIALVLACTPALFFQANAAIAVCEHVESATKYQSVEEALSAVNSGTILLLTDASAGTVALKSGMKLDLNGHTLTANLVVAMKGATIQDGAACAGGGLLKIQKDNLAFAQGTDNGIIPVWNGVDGYVFTKVTFQQMAKTAGAGAAQYIFLPRMSNADAAALLSDGGLDNDLKIKVCLTWNDGYSQQFYTYSDALVQQVFDGTGKWVFSLKITGIAGITDMVASPIAVTNSGAQITTTGTAITAG